jgi:hypothetical protein
MRESARQTFASYAVRHTALLRAHRAGLARFRAAHAASPCCPLVVHLALCSLRHITERQAELLREQRMTVLLAQRAAEKRRGTRPALADPSRRREGPAPQPP